MEIAIQRWATPLQANQFCSYGSKGRSPLQLIFLLELVGPKGRQANSNSNKNIALVILQVGIWPIFPNWIAHFVRDNLDRRQYKISANEK